MKPLAWLKWHGETLVWATHAYASAVWHLIRGHKVTFGWFDNDIMLWWGHMGCVACRTCNVGIWSRDWSWVRRLAIWACGRLGHVWGQDNDCDRCLL